MQESRLRETSHITSGAFVERVINRIKPNNIDEMLRGITLNVSVSLNTKLKNSSQLSMPKSYAKMSTI